MYIHKNIILVTVLLILLVGGVAVWSYTHRPATPQSTQFTGTIDAIEGDTITLTGGFVLQGSSASDVSLNDTLMTLITVEVKTDATTEIVGTLYTRPSLEQLKIKPGPYSMNDLPHVEQSMQLGDLAIGTPITVTAKGNIYGEASFTASRVDFTDMVGGPGTP